MKYFFDTEFHEYKSKPLMGRSVHTIELISIGIVAENNKEYYSISKDFDIEKAWKNDWLKENVLKSIFDELYELYSHISYDTKLKEFGRDNRIIFCIEDFRFLINKFGKTNEIIAKEIKEFVAYNEDEDLSPADLFKPSFKFKDVEFYAYYCSYDWVVFCFLFGRMIDLPNGFPMYCRDLKQTFDEKASAGTQENNERISRGIEDNKYLYDLKSREDYPKQDNEHNALDDAKWNLNLYKFLKTI